MPPTSGTEASLAAQMRVLALDYGSARCGCALSDATGTLATPIDPVLRPATKAGLRALRELVDERAVERVVVGLPLSLDGTMGPAALAAIDEAKELEAALAVPVESFDERLTTVSADRSLMEMKMKADARRRVVDKVAAAVMLQAWLDRRARTKDPR